MSLDTLRADYLNLYGYTEYPTSPELDAFGAENLVFDRAFVSEPRTLTSHMSLLTGLEPHRHGVSDDRPLARGIPTLALALQSAGFRTQAFVDGGYVRARWGFDRGFDRFREHSHDGFAEILPKAQVWARAHRGDRFFLFLHSYDVHSSGTVPFYDSPPPFRGTFSGQVDSSLKSQDRSAFRRRYKQTRLQGEIAGNDLRYIRATYAEGVRHVDYRVGRLLKTFRELGIYERALIVFWSDHGEGLFDHQLWSHGELFDHTTRVPLLMRIPGWEPAAGKRIASVVRSVDLMPTILELAGVPVPEGLDGRSLLPMIAGRDSEERLALQQKTKRGRRLFGVRSANHHYIRDLRTDQTWLFDVDADASERKNLHGKGGDVERALTEQLDAFIRDHDRALSLAEAEGGVRPRLELDEETQAQLRALGYMGDGELAESLLDADPGELDPDE